MVRITLTDQTSGTGSYPTGDLSCDSGAKSIHIRSGVLVGIMGLILSLVVVLAPGTQADEASGVQQKWQTAEAQVREACRSRRYGEAERQLSAFLEQHPHYPAALERQAWLLLEHLGHDQRRAFSDEPRSYPRRADPMRSLRVIDDDVTTAGRAAIVYQWLRRHSPPAHVFDAARAAMARAAELDSAHYRVELVEARIALFREEPHAAIRLLESLPQESLHSPRGRLTLAAATLDLGREDESLELAQGLLDEPDCELDARDLVYLLLAGRQQHARVVELLDESLRRFPGNADFLLARSGPRDQAESAAALREIGLSLQADPHSATRWVTSAYKKLRLDLPRQIVLADLNEAIALRPNSIIPYIFRGSLLVDEMKYAESLQDFDEAIRINPYVNRSFRGRAQVLETLGKLPEARRDLERARWLESIYVLAAGTENQTEAPRAWKSVARCAREAEDWVLDELAIGAAFEIDPEFDGAFYERAAMNLARGHLDEALSDINRALEIADDPVSQRLRGDVHCARQEWDAAIMDYEETRALGERVILAYESRAETRRNSARKAEAQADLDSAARIRALLD